MGRRGAVRRILSWRFFICRRMIDNVLKRMGGCPHRGPARPRHYSGAGLAVRMVPACPSAQQSGLLLQGCPKFLCRDEPEAMHFGHRLHNCPMQCMRHRAIKNCRSWQIDHGSAAWGPAGKTTLFLCGQNTDTTRHEVVLTDAYLVCCERPLRRRDRDHHHPGPLHPHEHRAPADGPRSKGGRTPPRMSMPSLCAASAWVPVHELHARPASPWLQLPPMPRLDAHAPVLEPKKTRRGRAYTATFCIASARTLSAFA